MERFQPERQIVGEKIIGYAILSGCETAAIRGAAPRMGSGRSDRSAASAVEFAVRLQRLPAAAVLGHAHSSGGETWQQLAERLGGLYMELVEESEDATTIIDGLARIELLDLLGSEPDAAELASFTDSLLRRHYVVTGGLKYMNDSGTHRRRARRHLRRDFSLWPGREGISAWCGAGSAAAGRGAQSDSACALFKYPICRFRCDDGRNCGRGSSFESSEFRARPGGAHLSPHDPVEGREWLASAFLLQAWKRPRSNRRITKRWNVSAWRLPHEGCRSIACSGKIRDLCDPFGI